MRGLAVYAGALALALLSSVAQAQPAVPRMVTEQGRHALLVEGKPFLILGAQVHNSSAWPAMLPKVWPAVEQMQANTVQVPIAWEQVEPKQGEFDFSFLDTLIGQARERNVRLILLWFATWKNNGPNYTPEWVKLHNDTYPRVINAKGERMGSLSPLAKSTLDADRKAFVQLMRHLKQVDAQRTVIMVQVQNETGTYGSVRDYSPMAQKVFESAVPAALVKGLRTRSGTWTQVFGKDADEFFHAWFIARYVEQIASAGKAEYPLPLYTNAALRDPINPSPPITYSSGGPTDNVLDIWKIGAPSLDLLAPDIYMPEYAKYIKVLEHYGRPDNALFVAETGNTATNARYLFAVLGAQGIGFCPFGIDFTGYSNYPLGALRLEGETLERYAMTYRLVSPMMRELAELSFRGKLHGVSEEGGAVTQTIPLGRWSASISYGRPFFGFPPVTGNPEPIGGVLIAELGPDEFLLTGYHARVEIGLADKTSRLKTQFARVEEGTYESGVWKFTRVWNGDQTDYGLNFSSVPQVLRVRLATY